MKQVLAMAFEDDKDRFEFLVVEGSPMNQHFDLPYVPIKIRATQGHANALVKELPPTMLAKLIFCRDDHKGRYPTRLIPQNPEDMPPSGRILQGSSFKRDFALEEEWGPHESPQLFEPCLNRPCRIYFKRATRTPGRDLL